MSMAEDLLSELLLVPLDVAGGGTSVNARIADDGTLRVADDGTVRVISP